MPFSSLITFLPAADLSATHRFYHDWLELLLALDQDACRIYRVADGGHLGFCTHLDREHGHVRSVILTLVTDEVDAWHRRLADAGADIEHEPCSNERFGIYHFFVRDPDGHRVEIQHFLEASP